jgi:hypothetical protein
MTVKINNSNVDFLIDTGSSINILDENTFKKIGSKPKLKRLNNGFHILINMNFHFDILQFTYSFEYITIFITQYFSTI